MTPAVILVAGGTRNWRARVASTLEAEGYAVRETATCSGALAMAAESRPDLVLLDLRLPDGDGFGLLARLRALPGGSTVSIVAVVGALEDLGSDRVVQADFTDYVVTPHDPARLLQTIRTHLPLR
ncbi:MAG: two-component system, sensor histidine kinase and response regulator [Thermomicrobiales bacterium]|nr:two-component system, sensor histidine kinase and response regulator [Thermomicrobiales bacterium]